jgi:toxin-antitoxin system PIN domain toxin
VIVGIDTDVLVHWIMEGAPRHRAARRFVTRQVKRGNQLGLTQQVVMELVHVVTDPRRFEHPLAMRQAIEAARALWAAPEVVRILPAPGSLERACDLLLRHRLGRKRILDTVLAAVLESAGVEQLASFNGSDYRVFGFIQVVEPA